MNTSGDRLKALLREVHLSASDFAKNRGVTPQHVNNWFKRGVPMGRLNEIAEGAASVYGEGGALLDDV
ncbi:MAG TPA: XRE family transcriptional regulator, partial [Gammaproteobacteria bacterium]|nr:XRE family transcriptional regulator [Gammaproteobacteria bacterium]